MILNVRRRTKIAGTLVFAAVFGAAVIPAVAAAGDPTLSVTPLDDLVIAAGKNFEAGPVEVVAEVEGGKGTASATASAKGTVVIAFQLPDEDFSGTVTVTATQGDTELTKSVKIGAATTPPVVQPTKPAEPTPATPAATPTDDEDEPATPAKPATPATPADAEPSSGVPDKSKAIKIMGVGDSIMQGHSVAGGARPALQKLFEDDGYNVEFVGDDNSGGAFVGKSGFKTTDIQPLIAKNMAAHDPDVVLLSIGGNDMMNGGAESIDANYRKLIKTFCDLKPGLQIDLALNHNLPQFASQMTTLNNTIKTIAADMDSSTCNLTVVDLYKQFPLADGLHPTADGYAQMADVWFPAVKADVDNVLAGK